MGTRLISGTSDELYKLKGEIIVKNCWDIRGGDHERKIILIEPSDYHPDTLELTISDLKKLLKPMGLKIVKNTK